MHFTRPVRQHQRRRVELGDDGRPGEAIAGAEGSAVEQRHLGRSRGEMHGVMTLRLRSGAGGSTDRSGAGMRPVASTRSVTSSIGLSSVKPYSARWAAAKAASMPAASSTQPTATSPPWP